MNSKQRIYLKKQLNRANKPRRACYVYFYHLGAYMAKPKRDMATPDDWHEVLRLRECKFRNVNDLATFMSQKLESYLVPLEKIEMSITIE
jgi:hypothetical protein